MKNLKTGAAKTVAAKKTKAKVTPKAKVKIKAASIAPEVKNIAKESCSCGCACEGSRFGKVFLGLILVLVGLFCLGRNFGFLPGINFDFQAIWPLLIILVGLFMVNRRSRVSIGVGIFAALVFMLVLAFIVSFSQTKTEYDSEAVMPALRHVERVATTSGLIESKDVVLSNVVVGQLVSSPFSVEGQARGAWYFEGSFPVKVLDESGKELGKGVAQAQGPWMTEELVPFKATLMFTRPTSSSGSLVLEKDNPSGLSQNDQKVVLPIKF